MLESFRTRLRTEGRHGARLSAPAAMRQDQIVWIFGYARSGSSWLARMMAAPPTHGYWNEPQVGEMLGSFYYLRYPQRRNPSFLLGDRHREVWEEGIRSLVLRGARVRHPHADLVVIKEPHGSIGAPLLSGALPASRMVLLLRDPRDMVASALDGQRRDSWASESLRRRGFERATYRADTDPDGFVEGRATQLMEHVMRAQEAYDSHPGPKAFVTYERLRSDPEASLRGIFSDLGIAVADHSIREAVEQEDWERVPPEERGEGKRLRKATPGAWREDLTAHQVTLVERVTGPLLERHYPDR